MVDIKFTDMDIIDANICFSREYLTKARAARNKDRLLKLLLLANQSITTAIQQIDSSVKIIKNKALSEKMKS